MRACFEMAAVVAGKYEKIREDFQMETYILNWKKLDPEAKWGLKGKKFTGVMNWSSFLLGGVFCMIFYAVLYPFRQMGDYQMVNMFFHGGPENRSTIPYYTVLLSCWCLAFLLIKWRKLCVQKKALKIRSEERR